MAKLGLGSCLNNYKTNLVPNLGDPGPHFADQSNWCNRYTEGFKQFLKATIWFQSSTYQSTQLYTISNVTSKPILVFLLL